MLLPQGHGLPGASAVEVSERVAENISTWEPVARAGALWLVRIWELSPLLSPHLRPFSRLSPSARESWVSASIHSRIPARRLVLMALKQLVFLSWASCAEVEDALGYDYRCARDDEPHGAGRKVIEPRALWRAPAEPGDYLRPGPATRSGAVPRERSEKRDFRPVTSADIGLETICWPAIDDGYVDTADVVVVGSGAGGAVAATTLAEAGIEVVVVEEGGQVSAEHDFSGPMFSRFQRFCRENGTSLIWARPPIPVPLGKVVGGTTVINSGTCFRAPDRVLNRWVTEHGLDSVSPDNLAAHYASIEEFLNVRPVPWDLLGPNGYAAHKGAVALGYTGGPLLRNIADCHGCGQCAFGCPTNAKQAMHISYLPRAYRSGARIYSRARVDRIEIDDGTAKGVVVSLLDDGGRTRGRMTIHARHVVVSAGSIHTPALLNSSGVPDTSRQTGRNLRIHPATGVSGLFDQGWVSWKGTLQSYYIDQFFDSHEVMFEATTAVPSIGAGSVPGIGADAMREVADMSRLATLGFYVSDTSKGRVRTLGGNRPIATYRLNQLDLRRLAKGIAVASEVLLAAGARRVHTGLPKLNEIDSRSDLEELEGAVRRDGLRLTAFHPMGTARMGSDPQRSVVRSDGRHHFAANLWVADASVFPSCVGVNPQMTIMALARSTAQQLMKSL
ncbi:MAG: GMC family oxidoreductase [Actinomycetota bacterium]|nr:GMC family oxidoreductase [Actinomycetota bacterium]